MNRKVFRLSSESVSYNILYDLCDMYLYTNTILICTCAFNFLRSINTVYIEDRSTLGNIWCVCVCVCDLLQCSRDTQLLYMKHRFLIHTCICIWRYYVIDDRPTVVEKTSYFIFL